MTPEQAELFDDAIIESSIRVASYFLKKCGMTKEQLRPHVVRALVACAVSHHCGGMGDAAEETAFALQDKVMREFGFRGARDN